MSMQLLTSPIVVTLLGALASLVIYMIKKLIERIHKLEEKSCNTVTRQETRTLIKDKTIPLEKQMAKIDAKLDKIIDIMLNDGR